MKHQVIHLGKGQASFFLQILVSVMVLSGEKWIIRLFALPICATHF